MSHGSDLTIVIVEDHNHCLEHIHATIRKKKVFHPWSLLHFDAHPDLACGSIPAAACFTPRQSPDPDDDPQDLYERLDMRTSGIAEWILPLVLACQLTTIDWVKPPFSNQLPLGRQKFQVGAWEPHHRQTSSSSSIQTSQFSEIQSFLDLSPKAVIKVDWRHPYYMEDDSVVDTKELALAETVELNVCEAKPEAQFISIASKRENLESPWILDICLDYFACLNPYLSDIDKINPAITNTFVNLLSQSKFSTLEDADNQPNKTSYSCHVQEFYSALEGAIRDPDNEQAREKVLEACSNPEDAIASLQELKELLHDYPDALQAVVDAIPYWHMPHAVASAEPPVSRQSLQDVEQVLSRLLEESSSRPFLITMARSTEDGFTPSHLVEEIQTEVVSMLQRVYGAKDDCSISVVKDYGEWEGASLY